MSRNAVTTPRHIDSSAALRALIAAVPDVPVTWHAAPDATHGGHYCAECLADYDDCPRTAGEHDTCPDVCASCAGPPLCSECWGELDADNEREVERKLCASCWDGVLRDMETDRRIDAWKNGDDE